MFNFVVWGFVGGHGSACMQEQANPPCPARTWTHTAVLFLIPSGLCSPDGRRTVHTTLVYVDSSILISPVAVGEGVRVSVVGYAYTWALFVVC